MPASTEGPNEAKSLQSIVVASNRGPIWLERAPDGSAGERRGVGGLVTAVGGALRHRSATWIAAAISDEERARAETGDDRLPVDLGAGEHLTVRFNPIDPDVYDAYYNQFSNHVLWFLHHSLWSPEPAPSLEMPYGNALEQYREVNESFARLIAEELRPGSIALPQDYHLSLVPARVRALQPETSIALFWHIPFCTPRALAELPRAWAAELLTGMLGADLIGFHTQRWATEFRACCASILGLREAARDEPIVHARGTTQIGAYPIGVDADELRAATARAEVASAGAALDALIDDRTLILRVDRTEPSKNILRGLVAYGDVLERRPDLRGRVVHIALLTPSRREIPEYQEYVHACLMRAERINERFARAGWTPVTVRIKDDYPTSLAAYLRYDVLVVNPVWDGMNLVAREGPVVNRRDGVLVLSRNAGAAAELHDAALMIDPFDVAATAAAIEQALDMPADERAARSQVLRARAPGTPPHQWLDRQIEDLARAH